MKNTKSLKLNRDFRRLYYRGKSVACGYVVIYAMKNRLTHNRLGLTCGKSIGKAVERNRVKRLMREGYRLSEDSLKIGYDLVMVARARANGQEFSKIFKDVRYAFNKLELIENNEKNIVSTD